MRYAPSAGGCDASRAAFRNHKASSRRFYNLFNILIGLKHDAEEQITRKPKETTKYKYIYKTNINTLIGNIKEELPRLLTDNQEENTKNS